MKVLSLKQPFAELILQNKKKIELRKWNTKFRGAFLIHASKIPDKKAMDKFGFILKNVKRIKPFEAKGKLGFWNLKII